MSTYRAPLRDMQFVLRELAGIDEIAKLPGYEEKSDVLAAVLDEASAFATEVLDPINRTGDIEGGWQMARAAQISATKIAAGTKDPFYAAKLVTARFYADHVLNLAPALQREIVHGSASVMTLTEEQFELDRQVLVVA